jgi:hypothetical protein
MSIATELEAARVQIEALSASAQSMTDGMAVLKSEIDSHVKANGGLVAEIEALKQSAEADKQALSASLEQVNKDLAEANRKLTLEPFADVSAGREKPLADAGEAATGDQKNVLEQMESMTLGSAERIAFYQANRVAIDALKNKKK